MVPKARHSRRGQGALEYLLTHGWALLVLALVIVILYGIGIFNPNRYVAEECVFQPGFGCASPARLHLSSFSASGGEKVKYALETDFTNNLGYDIAIIGIDVTSTDFITGGQFTCKLSTLGPSGGGPGGGPGGGGPGPAPPSPPVLYLSTDCMDWYSTASAPGLMLNGETQPIYLNFKVPPSEAAKETTVAAGEVKELKFTITYRNCNTFIPAVGAVSTIGGWQRGQAIITADRATKYGDCTGNMGLNPDGTVAASSTHVLSGKIVVRVGPQISTATVVG